MFYFNSNTEIEQVKMPNLTTKIVKPNLKNSSKEIIKNDSLNRVEVALQKPTNEIVETKKAQVSNGKYLNKISVKNEVIEAKSTDSESIAKNTTSGKVSISVSKEEIKEIKNPYQGSKMLTCGSVKKTY